MHFNSIDAGSIKAQNPGASIYETHIFPNEGFVVVAIATLSLAMSNHPEAPTEVKVGLTCLAPTY
jgi:hypothetical protein